MNSLNKIICLPEARIIYFYSTRSINLVLNLHSFDILYSVYKYNMTNTETRIFRGVWSKCSLHVFRPRNMLIILILRKIISVCLLLLIFFASIVFFWNIIFYLFITTIYVMCYIITSGRPWRSLFCLHK